jgi:hypothetical protein
MIAWSAAVGASGRARDAARDAARRARAALVGAEAPVLALAFASPSYDDVDAVPSVLGDELGPVPVAGGTAGGAVFDHGSVHPRGVLVALLGGDEVDATVVTTAVESPELVELVPAAMAIRQAAERAAAAGRESAMCLVFAPAIRVDGEALVAAVRKGTGAQIQLAGALTGDDFTFDRSCVFAEGHARPDRVVLAGVFTTSPVGVAARHGLPPVGPTRAVTRSDGAWLVALDGKPAREVWLADARAAGFEPPSAAAELLPAMGGYPLGIDVSSHVEHLVRSPLALRDDGAVLLAASVPERTLVRVMRAGAPEMLDAMQWAARLARERAGERCAGALLLACSNRLQELGARFVEEPAAAGRVLKGPVAGACVFGEIARATREVDAFHNMTSVVAAWPQGRDARRGQR